PRRDKTIQTDQLRTDRKVENGDGQSFSQGMVSELPAVDWVRAIGGDGIQHGRTAWRTRFHSREPPVSSLGSAASPLWCRPQRNAQAAGENAVLLMIVVRVCFGKQNWQRG